MGRKFEDELRRLKDICTRMDIYVKACIRKPVSLIRHYNLHFT